MKKKVFLRLLSQRNVRIWSYIARYIAHTSRYYCQLPLTILRQITLLLPQLHPHFHTEHFSPQRRGRDNPHFWKWQHGRQSKESANRDFNSEFEIIDRTFFAPLITNFVSIGSADTKSHPECGSWSQIYWPRYFRLRLNSSANILAY